MKKLAQRTRTQSDLGVPQKRTQDTQVNVRMTAEQRKRLDDARAKLVKGVSVPLGPWMLSLALAEADRVLKK